MLLAKALVISCSICLLLLSACDDSKSKKAKALADEQIKAQDLEQKIMKDPLYAIPELKKRLRESLRVEDGLMLINSPFGMGNLLGSVPFAGQFVLPASTPWVLSCGMGMSVDFGSSFRGDGSQVSNEVEIALTLASIDKNGCDTLGLAIGKEIEAISAGH